MRSSTTRRVAVLCVGALLWGVPAAYATHPAAGDCPHTHPETADRRSCRLVNSDPGSSLTCTIDGLPGRCVQEGKDCRCTTDKDFSQTQNLILMNFGMQTMIVLLGLKRPLGLPLICSQFGVLMDEFLVAKTAILALGPLAIYHPLFLGKLDFMLLNWLRVAKFASRRCAIPLEIALVHEALLQLKLQMLAAPLLLQPDPVF